ncbi:MAG: DEAD/DEAH box helicase [Gammaproteobacteria bacterium]|nr:DEAD/DEAH box helicase [Gammaproteobacteria bacterium]MCF6261892.1 DEAD/DEAH box helicase [Gammaproteobacteria bacterium]
MIFTLTDITTHFSAAHFTEGWRLFTDNQITALNIQHDGELITAVIPQASKHSLRVYVRTRHEQNTLTINGECSCKKKQNCMHVVATLLQALDDRQMLPGNTDVAISGFINQSSRKPLKKTHKKATAKPTDTQQVLLYLLELDDEDTLQVKTIVARHLKYGGYSTGRSFNPGRAMSRTPPRFLDSVDLALMDTLNQLPCAADAGTFLLAGPQSIHILEDILDTGRCYFDSVEWGTLLSQGAERQLDFHWAMDDFGYQRGEWQITPEADSLLPLSSPWYFDDETGECGPLLNNLPVDLIHKLMTMAPMPPEQAAKTNKDLLETWPDSMIPPLQVLEIETLPPVKPVPCLRLTTEDEPPMFDEWTESSDSAYLSFAYKDDDGNDMKISRDAPSTCISNGRLIHIQRDENVEQATVKQLRKLGFDEDDDPDFTTSEDCFFLGSRFEDDDAEAWLSFQMDDLPVLRAQGWRIEYDNFRYQLTEASRWTCDVKKLEQQDWFDMELGVEVDGQHIDLLPILLNFLSNFPRGLPDAKEITTEHFIIPFDNAENEERLLSLPAAKVLPLLETLLEIYHNTHSTDHQNLRLSRIQLAQFSTLNQDGDGIPLQWLGDDDVQQLVQRLRDLDGIPEVTPPTGLTATLRPYQQQGLNWLQFLREYQLAGILADDMGLGKTVQALAHLLLEKEAGRANRPSLVIAPTSLMFNWRHETERFAPALKVLVLHGPQRKQHFPAIADHDLIITTYPLLARDKSTLLAHDYHLLILDEAQVIKNPKAQAGRVARDINARHRLCLTGTPMENHLGELWSLFDFLLPGLLGDHKQFRRFFRSPIEKHESEATAERLSRRVRPFLLRRTKQQVATELPPKTEIIQTVMLEGKQRELYETVRLAMHRRVREEIERQGMGRSHIVVLDALLKLRQVCCDPRLVKIDKANDVNKNAKLEMLMELLPEMVEEGRRILLFSQFTTMLGFIEDELKKANIDYVKLTGQTRDRETPVKNFQDGKVPLFLISLKAGGVGLNLTTADTVIHYDPWWNPAVERQATDRAHRIGQQQAVFVYKFICEGTLEEKIQAMQQRKQALADGLYQDDGQNEAQWNEQDLEALFQPLGGD